MIAPVLRRPTLAATHLIRPARALGALLLAAVVLVPAGTARADHGTGDGLATESRRRAADAGVDGNAYESPSWGYTLEWDDDVWEPAEATSEDGLDLLLLRSRSSSLYVVGGEGYRGDPAACLDDWVDALSGEQGVSDWEPLEDEDGEPVAGERRDRAWAAFTLTYTNDDGDEFENANYLECRTLVEGEATLTIFHITSQDAYGDEAEVVAELLDTMELPEEDEPSRDRNDADGKAARLRRNVTDLSPSR